MSETVKLFQRVEKFSINNKIYIFNDSDFLIDKFYLNFKDKRIGL